MNPITFRTALALATFALGACSDASQTNTTATASGTGAPPSAEATASASSGPIGLAPCDEYIARMRVCIEGAPEDEREPRKKALDAVEKNWIDQVKVTDSRERAAIACGAALEGFMKSEGCAEAKGPTLPSLAK